MPLGLLVGAWVFPVRSLQRTMLAYWRASSLLVVTVYLMAAEQGLGFGTGWAARWMIIGCLLFFERQVSVTETTRLAQTFRLWRTAIISYNLVGLVWVTPFLGCIPQVPLSAICRVMLEPPQQFTGIFNPGVRHNVFNYVGLIGLGLYLLYFSYWLLLGRKRNDLAG